MVYGVSTDDVKSQAAFRKAQNLAFELLSDVDASVAAKYQVMMNGRPFARRVTFVLDPKGIIRLIDDKVDVNAHGTQLATRIRALQ